MSKLVRNLLFAVVIMLILGALAVWATPKILEYRQEAAKTPIPKSVYVINYGADYTVDSFEVVRRDSDEVTSMSSALDENGSSRVWTMKDYPDATVDAYNLSAVTGTMKQLGSTGVAAESQEYKANFGLDDPAYTVTIHYTNGVEEKLYIGDENPGKTGYYVVREGDERIFMINTLAVHYLTTEYYGFWSVPSFVGAEETITEVSVERPLKDETVTLLVVESGSYGNANTGRLSEPYDIQANVDAQKEFITLVANQITGPSGLINPNPTQAELEEYGLADPEYRLTVKTTTGDMTLTLGHIFDTDMSIEDAYRYCLVNDDKAVYRFDKMDGDGILDIQASTLADPLLNYISLSYLDEVDFRHGDVKVNAKVKQVYSDMDGNSITEAEAEDLGGGNINIDQEVTINGKTVERRTFGGWYTYVVGLRVYGELPADFAPEGTAVAELKCSLNDRSTGMGERVIRFYEYRKDFYAVEIDGNFDFYVSASALTDISDNVKLLSE